METIYLANKSIIESAVLNTANWQDNIYIYTTENIISDTQLIELLPAENITLEQYNALSEAIIIGDGQSASNKTITLKALSEAPTIDIPVTFIFRGDSK